ncbi:MAG: HupE/UreJ family protein [bacterium]
MIRLFLLLVFMAGPATAHETTRSYLTLTAQDSDVTADVRIAFRDVEVAVWMDENLDGQITWGEAKRRLDAVQTYLLSNVALTTAQGACTFTRTDATTLTDAGIDYLDLGFTATCPPQANPTFTLHSTLFTDIDPDHRMFLTAMVNHIRSTALISRAAPDLVLDAKAQGWMATFTSYFRAGIDHLAGGSDHIVFLLALMLPFVCSTRGPKAAATGILAAVTGFTLAHALTLTAAATQILRPNSAMIEALIALSIMITAVDNIRPFLRLPRAAVAAFFGTIHGFGFASALGTLNLSGVALATALLGFNLGIEAAQIVLVLLTMPVLYLLGAGRWVLWSGSAAAAAIGTFWLLQRLPLLF